MNREIRLIAWVVIWFFLILGCCEGLLAAGYPWRYSSLEPYLLRDNADDWTHNAFGMQKIKEAASLKNKQQVYIFLGGSVGVEAITTDQEMSQMLSDGLHRPTMFRSIVSSYKTFADEMKIVEDLGSINATFIINTEILRLKTANNIQLSRINKETGVEHFKYYFLATGSSQQSILEKYNISVRAIDQFRVFKTSMVIGEILKKRMRRVLFSNKQIKVTHIRHSSDGKKPVSVERQRVISTILDVELGKITRFHNTNYQLLRAIIKTAQSNGNRVILAESPINPLFLKQMQVFTPAYNKLINGLVVENDLVYIDLRDVITWEPKDFRDLHHMLPPGREKFSRILADNIIALGL